MAASEELIKMIPTYATNYPAGLDIANTIAAAKFYIRPTFTSKAAHFAHVIGRNFCHVVKFAEASSVSCAASFFPHISMIVGGCSNKQVGRIATRPIVALVANKHTIRDGAIRELIGHYMSAVSFIVLAACNAIARIVDIRLPLPTVIGSTTIYSLPEPFGRLLERLVMPQTILRMLPGHTVKSVVCTFRNRSSFSTAAKALAARVRDNLFGFIENGGILEHADISFVDIGHVPGRSNVAGTLLYPRYCSTIEHTCNKEVAHEF